MVLVEVRCGIVFVWVEVRCRDSFLGLDGGALWWFLFWVWVEVRCGGSLLVLVEVRCGIFL
jgi:hypothetical protein